MSNKKAVFNILMYSINKTDKDLILTTIWRFALGCEDNEAKALILPAVERDVKRLMVQCAGHR